MKLEETKKLEEPRKAPATYEDINYDSPNYAARSSRTESATEATTTPRGTIKDAGDAETDQVDEKDEDEEEEELRFAVDDLPAGGASTATPATTTTDVTEARETVKSRRRRNNHHNRNAAAAENGRRTRLMEREDGLGKSRESTEPIRELEALE